MFLSVGYLQFFMDKTQILWHVLKWQPANLVILLGHVDFCIKFCTNMDRNNKIKYKELRFFHFILYLFNLLFI
jgi:hypothetical protein